MKRSTLIKIISPLSPYVAVALGLYVFGNGWISFLIYHFLLFCFILAAGNARLFKKIFVGWHKLAGTIAVPAGALSGVVVWMLWPNISIEPENLPFKLSEFGLSGYGWVVFVLTFVLINPVMEEVFWRGFLEDEKKGKWPWAADILFAGYHLPVLAFIIKPWWLLLAFAILCGGAMAWRWLNRGLDGLAVAFASHIAADVSIIVAVQVLVHTKAQI